MNDIKKLIEEYAQLLPLGTSISFTDAEKRAGMFLSGMALVSDAKHTLAYDKIKALSIQTAVYAQEMSKGTAKTVTENKSTAEASQVYIVAREELERIDADISYLRAYYDIFNNAHIFYRGMAKGDNL